MRQIRKNVFETNSSSTHAMCIAKDTDRNSVTIPENIYISAGEFGWGYEEFNDVENKISYLITAIQYTDEPEKYEDKLREFLDSFNIEYELDRTCLQDNWYIDHQSIDTAVELVERVFLDENLLFNYLFDENSTLLIGNDNSETIYEELYSDYENSWDNEELKDKYKNMEVIR